MKTSKVIGVILVLTAAVYMASGCGPRPAASPVRSGNPTAVQADVWTCSMHPQVRQPGPRQCPICGMNLVPAAKAEPEPK